MSSSVKGVNSHPLGWLWDETSRVQKAQCCLALIAVHTPQITPPPFLLPPASLLPILTWASEGLMAGSSPLQAPHRPPSPYLQSKVNQKLPPGLTFPKILSLISASH